MECDKEMDTTTSGDNNNNYKNNKFELANPKKILMSTQIELSITTPICTKRAQMVINCVYYKGCRIRVCVGRFLTLMKKNGFNSTHTKLEPPVGFWVQFLKSMVLV
jgi:hypothetical protein